MAISMQHEARPVVFVVDDDVAVRESLEVLIASADWEAETFACAHEFLAHPRIPAPSCLVLDVSLSDINGLDLQSRIGAALSQESELQALRERQASLTRREREVMALVVAGLLNKIVADELGICEVTVKAHRGCVMRKMRAGSVADLVRIAARLDSMPPAAPIALPQPVRSIPSSNSYVPASPV